MVTSQMYDERDPSFIEATIRSKFGALFVLHEVLSISWLFLCPLFLTGHCMVVREGLTNPWIPDNWSWGGVASDHCPVFAEFYADLLRSLADLVWQWWTGETFCPNMSGDIGCSKDRTEWHEDFNLSGFCFISVCCGAVSYKMWTSAKIAFWVSGYQWKIVNEKYSSHNKCLDKNMMYFKRNVPNILYMYRKIKINW